MSKKLHNYAALILAGCGRSVSERLKLIAFRAYWTVIRKPVLLFRPCGAVGGHRRWVTFVGTHQNLGFAGSPPTAFFFFCGYRARPEPMDFGLLPVSYALRHVRNLGALVFIRC